MGVPTSDKGRRQELVVQVVADSSQAWLAHVKDSGCALLLGGVRQPRRDRDIPRFFSAGEADNYETTVREMETELHLKVRWRSLSQSPDRPNGLGHEAIAVGPHGECECGGAERGKS